MIILQTGVPGSGKTSSVVNMLITDESYTHFTDKDGVKKKTSIVRQWHSRTQNRT